MHSQNRWASKNKKNSQVNKAWTSCIYQNLLKHLQAVFSLVVDINDKSNKSSNISNLSVSYWKQVITHINHILNKHFSGTVFRAVTISHSKQLYGYFASNKRQINVYWKMKCFWCLSIWLLIMSTDQENWSIERSTKYWHISWIWK